MDANSSNSERICPTCGSAVALSSPFCTICGAALPAESAGAAAPAARSSPAESPAPAPDPEPVVPVEADGSASSLGAGRRRSIAMLVALVSVVGIVTLVWLAAGDDPQRTTDVVATEDTSVESSTSVADTTTPATTTPPSTTPSTTTVPTAPPATSPVADVPQATDPFDPWVTDYFPTPEEAIADWLSQLALPFAGPCETLAGSEAELGGSVLCSELVEDLAPAQIHIWGVFGTDDFGGWILVDVGSAGWSVADESFEYERPEW